VFPSFSLFALIFSLYLFSFFKKIASEREAVSGSGSTCRVLYHSIPPKTAVHTVGATLEVKTHRYILQYWTMFIFSELWASVLVRCVCALINSV
jgi:hypothetical protein